jgi:hypothetical protein
MCIPDKEQASLVCWRNCGEIRLWLYKRGRGLYTELTLETNLIWQLAERRDAVIS